MDNKLSWEEIKKRYRDEWVQLVDYEWEETEPYPRSGVVRVHHKDKKEFKNILAAKDKPKESALLYTGDKLLPQHGIFSSNLHQYMGSS